MVKNYAEGVQPSCERRNDATVQIRISLKMARTCNKVEQVYAGVLKIDFNSNPHTTKLTVQIENTKQKSGAYVCVRKK
jgi:hypothetical protein